MIDRWAQWGLFLCLGLGLGGILDRELWLRLLAPELAFEAFQLRAEAQNTPTCRRVQTCPDVSRHSSSFMFQYVPFQKIAGGGAVPMGFERLQAARKIRKAKSWRFARPVMSSPFPLRPGQPGSRCKCLVLGLLTSDTLSVALGDAAVPSGSTPGAHGGTETCLAAP